MPIQVKLPKLFCFFPEYLGTTLAKIAAPQLMEFANQAGVHVLGNSHQLDIPRIPVGPLRRSLDSLQDPVIVVSKLLNRMAHTLVRITALGSYRQDPPIPSMIQSPDGQSVADAIDRWCRKEVGSTCQELVNADDFATGPILFKSSDEEFHRQVLPEHGSACRSDQ